jgi:hypothetical protein
LSDSPLRAALLKRHLELLQSGGHGSQLAEYFRLHALKLLYRVAYRAQMLRARGLNESRELEPTRRSDAGLRVDADAAA